VPVIFAPKESFVPAGSDRPGELWRPGDAVQKTLKPVLAVIAVSWRPQPVHEFGGGRVGLGANLVQLQLATAIFEGQATLVG